MIQTHSVVLWNARKVATGDYDDVTHDVGETGNVNCYDDDPADLDLLPSPVGRSGLDLAPSVGSVDFHTPLLSIVDYLGLPPGEPSESGCVRGYGAGGWGQTVPFHCQTHQLQQKEHS